LIPRASIGQPYTKHFFAYHSEVPVTQVHENRKKTEAKSLEEFHFCCLRKLRIDESGSVIWKKAHLLSFMAVSEESERTVLPPTSIT